MFLFRQGTKEVPSGRPQGRPRPASPSTVKYSGSVSSCVCCCGCALSQERNLWFSTTQRTLNKNPLYTTTEGQTVQVRNSDCWQIQVPLANNWLQTLINSRMVGGQWVLTCCWGWQLKLIPRTHKAEGENRLPQVVLRPPPTHTYTCTNE